MQGSNNRSNSMSQYADSSPFYARTSDHGYETCVEHLCMAGCLTGGFAQQFSHLDDGLLAGLFHDLGKYSQGFQKRIRDPEHTGKVDHSTAGAMLLVQNRRFASALAVAGHHAGLTDFGSAGDQEGSTFSARMNRAFSAGDNNPLTLAGAWERQICVPQSALQAKRVTALEKNSQVRQTEDDQCYSDMMLTRMLLSALVDGDRLDAEFFTSNREDRAEHQLLEQLKERLGSETLSGCQAPAWNVLHEAALTVSAKYQAENHSRINHLTDVVESVARRYLESSHKTPLDVKRCELLAQCLDQGRSESCKPGLYTLTAPTGSGKTIASITFALEHARTNNMQRVIYVIPYTSIIDQTVGQFEKLFGESSVLPHYSEAPYQLKDESDMDGIDLKRALAAENWNAPIVVTTAVQFFESLYSNKTSRCRKLHNIANSVIVFDEAQTLPVPYLRPCVKVIAELVEHYGATAVLCTATQPELQRLFDQSFSDGRYADIPEISPFTNTDYEKFRRVTVERIGDIELAALADRLGRHVQVLCVVNTRKKAQYLYSRLSQGSESQEGTFCLTTLQCAADRKRLLSRIRDRLAAGEPCRVMSTSLIEAGVDVDFPVAYREETGLDSIIQAAGRCNREGKRPAGESMVYVFSTTGGQAPFLQQNLVAYRETAARYSDLISNDAVRAYFGELLGMLGDNTHNTIVGNDAFDVHRIVPLHGHDKGMSFERIARLFKLIDTPTVPVYIPLSDDELGDEGARLCNQLEQGDINRALFRKLGKYAVNVWPQHLEKLQSAGAVLSVGEETGVVEENCYILRDLSLYSSRLGLQLENVAADGIFV
ncbi:CRISPR-associated helicase cas3 [Bifidobacterium saguini DSM 23967]|uniref:CRISPR-associated helicase cas3 n=2 Tax=Bifidobacterium saguini TaxID=762210 RepID=A0A087DA54_9BIFI|nr:CRISPR-associated helicase Cas3' [Bifidobacterium saguini]KFI92404.1 CRISPR-associated helicase cas3 [Bifidobacterium saguini DSM 23967]QTB91093.1 CRISPR-associated helicase Cas3' [Bifidobacterium saguini]